MENPNDNLPERPLTKKERRLLKKQRKEQEHMLLQRRQKIKRNHFLLMVLCCFVPMVLIIGALSWRKGNNYWAWLIILLCPIMHIWLMKDHKHNKAEHQAEGLYKCPECGLEYREKEWAEKCENWCQKHKSCNLEIAKHSIQN